ncbi:Two component regulator propeller [mine drainage metagenome]|uniref:Two component regulator propeller n=1 Tax=mine drainage metagenome TaxID=410659 RepID=A0A1J5SCR3_9ZZZZ
MIRSVFPSLGRLLGLAVVALMLAVLPDVAHALDGFAPNPNSVVNVVAQQADGKLLVGGFFTSLEPDSANQAIPRTYLARINRDGSVDTSFAPNPNASVDSILVLPDQSIIIGGQFTSLQPAGSSTAIPCNHLAHIYADGSVDTAFGASVSGSSALLGTPDVYTLLRQPDGKILVGGFFDQVEGKGDSAVTPRTNLVRFNSNGTLDTSFQVQTNGLIMTLVQDSSGSVLVGGGFTAVTNASTGASVTRNRMARILADGTVDSTFDPNFNNRVNAILVQPDGTIIVGGGFTSLQPNGASTASARAFLASLGHDGSLNSRFASSYNGAVNALASQPDGMILIGGAFNGLSVTTGTSSLLANYIVRVRPDGTADPTFQARPAYTVSSILVQSDGNIVIGGFFSGVMSRASGTAIPRWYLARLTANGSLDTELNGNTGMRIDSIYPLKNGQYLLTGGISNISGVTVHNLARINADGTLDPTFTPVFNGTPVAFAEQSDGKIVVSGSFTQVDGVTRNNIARLNADGTLDTSYDPNVNGGVYALALQSDGKILAGGSFNTVQPNGSATATTIIDMARFNTDGTLDTSFDAGPGSTVNCIKLDSKGRIYVGGAFTYFSGAKNSKTPTANYMARLNSDGSVDTSFAPVFNNSVTGFWFESDTSILVTGSFTGVQDSGTVTTYTRNHIARVDDKGVFDSKYDPNLNASVRDLVILPDGTAVIGGYFTALAPDGATTAITDHIRLVRLNKDGTLYTSFNPTPNGAVSSVVLRSDGSLFVAGGFMTLDPNGASSWIRSPGLAVVNTDGTVDSSFELGKLPALSGDVRGIGVQEDGLYVVGGSFAGLLGSPGANLARIDAESSADPTFDPNPNGPVNSIAMIPTSVGNNGLSNVIGWLNSNGTLTSGLNLTNFPTLTGHAGTIAQLPNGQFLVGGNFYSITGTLYYDMIRLNADGSVDPNFTLTFNGIVDTILVQPDGSIIVGGNFSQISGQSILRLARIKADGTLDTSFNPAPNGEVFAVVRQPSDGKLVIGGSFTGLSPNGATTSTIRNYIARINTDGTLDTSYDPNAQSTVSALAIQSDGKVIVGGSFISFAPHESGTTTRYYIGRINTDGTIDTAFNPDANSSVTALAIQSDGKILIGGTFTTLTPNGATAATTRTRFARLNTDGTVDTTMPDLAVDAQIEAIVPQSDGSIYLGGMFSTVNNTRRNYIAKISSTGTVDTAFNPNPDQDVAAITVLSNGQLVIAGGFTTIRPYGSILIGGNFSQVSGDPANNLAFLNQQGDLLSSYNVGTDGEVKAILRLQDGTFLVGGAFTQVNGTAQPAFARLQASGALDTTFTPAVANGTNKATVDTIALQPDGKILIGGSFMSVNGSPRSNLARLNADGTIDSGFTVTADDQVDAIAYGPDGSVYVAGSFKSLGGSGVAYLARLKTDGTVDSSFNPAPNAPVSSISVSVDGTLVVGGSFTQIAGTQTSYLARLNSDGTLSSDATAVVNGPVTSLLGTYDGRTFVGGAFTQFDGSAHYLLGRIGTVTPATNRMTLSSDLSTVTWTQGGSGPVLPSVAFDYSTDLRTWTRLGMPTYNPATGVWTLTGQSFTAGTLFFVRAQGIQTGGTLGSDSLINAVWAFYPSSSSQASGVASVIGTTGHSISFSVGDGSVDATYSATGLPAGVTIDAATGLVSGIPTTAGTYSVVFTISHGGVVSTISQTWTVLNPSSTVPSGNPGQRLLAISSLSNIPAGQTETLGVAILGSASKKMLLRAVGPSMANFNVANPATEPLLKLYNQASTAAPIVTNQGWNNDATVTAVSAAVGDFPLNQGSADAATVQTLQPGLYTMQSSDASGNGGTILSEIYDADSTTAASKMMGLSCNGYVSGDGTTLTAGFVVGGTVPQRVLVRGVGPGLAAQGVAAPLSDPKIALYSISNGISTKIAANDNWETQTALTSSQVLADAGQLDAAFTQTGDFALASGSTDSAMLVTLNPGVYTLVVSGANNTSGTALAEIYLLP